MKKKQIISKLKFQKTTIVSFKTLKNVIGKSFANVDTVAISINGVTCHSFVDCQTRGDEHTCLSCQDGECTRPTNTGSKVTDFCGGTGNGTKTNRNCSNSINC
ncbi:MAG: hypothetical protein AAF617_15550 [Bacteroidota bacterium]